MHDLPSVVIGRSSGKPTSFFRTLENVALRFGPLNGVVANWSEL
jgi:hypothetical protein